MKACIVNFNHIIALHIILKGGYNRPLISLFVALFMATNESYSIVKVRPRSLPASKRSGLTAPALLRTLRSLRASIDYHSPFYMSSVFQKFFKNFYTLYILYVFLSNTNTCKYVHDTNIA